LDPVSHPAAIPRQARISPRVVRDGRMSGAFIVCRGRDRYFAGKVDPRSRTSLQAGSLLGKVGKSGTWMNPDGGKSPQGPPEESFRPGRETFGKEATVLGLSIHG